MPVNALSGAELLEVIIAKMRKELSEHPDFAVHLTHPRVQWEMELKLHTPMSADTERTHVLAGDTAPPGRPAIPAAQRSTRSIRMGSELITRPDQARAEAGLTIPERTLLPSGDIADYKPGEAPGDKLP